MYGWIEVILLPLGIQTWKVIVCPGATTVFWIYTDDDPDKRAVEVHGQRLLAGIVLRG